jgi:cytochrome P450
MDRTTELRGWAAYGALAHLIVDPLAATRRIAARGSFVAMRPAFRTKRPPIIHLTGAVYAEHILKNYKLFENGGVFVKGYRGSVHNKLRKGYFSANGSEYEHYIKIFGPLFRKSIVEQAYGGILERVNQAMDLLPTGEVIDMTAVVSALMKQLASACMFKDPEPRAGLRAADAVERHGRLSGASLGSLIAAKYGRPPLSALHRQAAVTYDAIVGWGETRKACPPAADVLSAIVNSPDESGNAASPDRIAGYGWTMLGASYDTSTSILSWLFVLLAAHPAVAARLYEELRSVSPDTMSDLGSIMDLPYLDGVIREALRLIPPAPIQRRKAIIDTEIAGDEIPAGSQVLISAWMTNRDPSIYANPDKFDPERWQGVTRSPYQWLTFSAGPRRCLGIWFAFAFLKAIMAAVVSRWRPEIPDGARIDMKVAVTVRPRPAVPVILRKHDGRFRQSEIAGNLHRYLRLG